MFPIFPFKSGRAPGAAEEEEDDSEGSEGEEGSKEEPGSKMSMSRMTGLAKLPNVIEWLTHALGDATRSLSPILTDEKDH